jgi:hypothetical protein
MWRKAIISNKPKIVLQYVCRYYNLEPNQTKKTLVNNLTKYLQEKNITISDLNNIQDSEFQEWWKDE